MLWGCQYKTVQGVCYVLLSLLPVSLGILNSGVFTLAIAADQYLSAPVETGNIDLCGRIQRDPLAENADVDAFAFGATGRQFST